MKNLIQLSLNKDSTKEHSIFECKITKDLWKDYNFKFIAIRKKSGDENLRFNLSFNSLYELFVIGQFMESTDHKMIYSTIIFFRNFDTYTSNTVTCKFNEKYNYQYLRGVIEKNIDNTLELQLNIRLRKHLQDTPLLNVDISKYYDFFVEFED